MNLTYLPNILSIFRIIIVPFYLVSLYLIGGFTGVLIAFILFVTAGITDFLDGYLARKLNCVTDFGKIIDPLADKLIVSVALISLVFKPIAVISIYPVIIIIAREVLVTLLRKHYTRRSVYISANCWGKVKTAVQMTGIIATLLYVIISKYFNLLAEYKLLIESSIRIFFWVVVVITIVSGISYLIQPKKNN